MLFRRVYGDESNENIRVLTELGNALKYVGKFEESLRLLSKVEKMVLKIWGKIVLHLLLAQLANWLKFTGF